MQSQEVRNTLQNYLKLYKDCIPQRAVGHTPPFWRSMIKMMKNIRSYNEPGRTSRALICAVIMALAIGWLYRYQIMNGFTVLAGDRYDAVISTTILEHWYNVFRGQAHWADVGYFFPYTRSIAQSDAYFILGVLYAPLRALGFDQFTAAELVNMAMKAIGFISAYVMCRRVFALPFYWSVLAATLFTLSNGMTVHSSRSQLATVALAPIMTLLLWEAGHALVAGNTSRLRTYGAYAGILFGAWCLTCFYVSWFFFFFALTMLAVAAWRGGKPGIAATMKLVRQHATSIILILAVTLLALAPFLYAFVPKARETGTRHFGDALFFTVPVENILQVGNENLFLGKLYNGILLRLDPSYVPAHEYYNTGIALALFLVFVAGAIQLYKRAKQKQDFFLVCMMVATVVTWILTIRIQGHSLWIIPFHLVPGARALRVVAAYEIFLALPIIVIAVRYLARRNPAWPGLVILSAVLILEELNTPGLALDRKAELARIALSAAPPKACQVFYTSGWKDQASLGGPADMYAHNVSAMLIAQEVDIPTVNGVASFQPRDWDFAKPQSPDYDARVASYASKHGISGLCRLDLDNKTWEMIPQTAIRRLPLDVSFFKKSAWPGGIAEMRGMSSPEAWGTWSDDKVVTLDFTEPLPERFELRLEAHAFADNIGKEFVIRLDQPGTASGTDVAATFTLGATDQQRQIVIDNPHGARTLHITVPHPVSPRELGAEDDRRLGIGVHQMEIVPLTRTAATNGNG